MSRMIPAIILSAQTPALGVVKALGRQGVPLVVVHYDPADMAHHSRYVTKTLIAPDPQLDEAGFVARVMELASEWKGAVLMPTSDATLLVAARHKEVLSRHFLVACPDYATACQVVDKQKTYKLAITAGVPAPRTLIPQSREDVQRMGTEVLFPCLIKPEQSHLFYTRFGVKMFVAEDLTQLIDDYSRAFAAGLKVVIQEYIPGGDGTVVNYNCYAVAGKVLTEFTADHIRNAPPWFGSPRVVRSRQIDALLAPGKQLMQALNYTGYACTEFKLDRRDGQYKLLDINGRHNLSTLLAVSCGINFPWLEYRRHAYGDIPGRQMFQSGTYWIDVIRDIPYSLKYYGEEKYALRDYLRPYLHPHIWAICDWRDPLPFLHRISHFVGATLLGKRRSSSLSKVLTERIIHPLRGLTHYSK